MDTRDEIVTNRPIAADGGVVDGIQHGIDDNPDNDAEKGATLGGLGGAAVGLAAGAAAGPVGAIAGAIIGGAAGALMSGAAVAAVDAVDNDNKVSGVGPGVHVDESETPYANSTDTTYNSTRDMNYVPSDPALRSTPVYSDPNPIGNGVPGIQTGGVDADGSPDSRGILEKSADFVTGDNVDDKRGVPVGAGSTTSGYNTNANTGYNQIPGESMPSLKTGGTAYDGTPDTRGVGEKVADAVTGDVIDDKTGKRVR